MFIGIVWFSLLRHTVKAEWRCLLRYKQAIHQGSYFQRAYILARVLKIHIYVTYIQELLCPQMHTHKEHGHGSRRSGQISNKKNEQNGEEEQRESILPVIGWVPGGLTLFLCEWDS